MLTTGPRCADWFCMRKFRITGTVAGIILLSDPYCLLGIGHEQSQSVSRTKVEFMKLLVGSWFSTTTSTEPMMRGTVNETSVLSSLRRKKLLLKCTNVIWYVWHQNIGLHALLMPLRG